MSAGAARNEASTQFGAAALVGSWDVTLTLVGLPPGRVLATFDGDGGPVESANTPPALRGRLARSLGTDRARPVRDHESVLQERRPQTGAYLGTQRVNATVRVAADSETFTAVSVSELSDPDGNLVVGGLRGNRDRQADPRRPDPRTAVGQQRRRFADTDLLRLRPTPFVAGGAGCGSATLITRSERYTSGVPAALLSRRTRRSAATVQEGESPPAISTTAGRRLVERGQTHMSDLILYVDKFGGSRGSARRVEDRPSESWSSSSKQTRPRLIAYNVYLSEDGTEMTVVNVHPDSASLEYHLAVAGPLLSTVRRARPALSSIHIYGKPSEKVLKQSHKKARLLGRGAVVVEPLFAGFARLAATARPEGVPRR